ncbi:ankyrin repeat domain-containing protein [Pseudoalteromonas sp. SR44-5]|uniref:ankyrin repeat domain-containing protein n=1 Tax=Pseudoalteromonas TaxID=53246 RepID=UPI0016007BF9|nr:MULTISPECIES: ankyrin repeat domain-containing protein [unclassified Pseudoalteromonas]MBB1335320.1 ankyrin repeat domain-containing protein [Pseudoalteromonas sp. SR41-6]MBB1343475.1 ankyrin repeat domain-containing protein [Pseudoalteromonas sp. SR45-6]MBB1368041.1 ankyrin repeat domain-containing protein [Pseudoalteromonas sp. SR44-5]MBB1419205.1 ankyrin repeat domain-containing protein [Pseudoalteromonas sp. SG44-1]MBB1423575.1 ankyrin repeat domain-containing protein [Pseudoalteromonas
MNISGKTELMLSIENLNLDKIKQFIYSEYKSLAIDDEMFKKDSTGRSAIYYAALRGDEDIIWFLLSLLPGTGIFCKRGQLLESKDNQGLTPEEFAQVNGNDKIYKLLCSERMRIEFFE